MTDSAKYAAETRQAIRELGYTARAVSVRAQVSDSSAVDVTIKSKWVDADAVIKAARGCRARYVVVADSRVTAPDGGWPMLANETAFDVGTAPVTIIASWTNSTTDAWGTGDGERNQATVEGRTTIGPAEKRAIDYIWSLHSPTGPGFKPDLLGQRVPQDGSDSPLIEQHVDEDLLRLVAELHVHSRSPSRRNETPTGGPALNLTENTMNQSNEDLARLAHQSTGHEDPQAEHRPMKDTLKEDAAAEGRSPNRIMLDRIATDIETADRQYSREVTDHMQEDRDRARIILRALVQLHTSGPTAHEGRLSQDEEKRRVWERLQEQIVSELEPTVAELFCRGKLTLRGWTADEVAAGLEEPECQPLAKPQLEGLVAAARETSHYVGTDRWLCGECGGQGDILDLVADATSCPDCDAPLAMDGGFGARNMGRPTHTGEDVRLRAWLILRALVVAQEDLVGKLRGAVGEIAETNLLPVAEISEAIARRLDLIMRMGERS